MPVADPIIGRYSRNICYINFNPNPSVYEQLAWLIYYNGLFKYMIDVYPFHIYYTEIEELKKCSFNFDLKICYL